MATDERCRVSDDIDEINVNKKDFHFIVYKITCFQSKCQNFLSMWVYWVLGSHSIFLKKEWSYKDIKVRSVKSGKGEFRGLNRQQD